MARKAKFNLGSKQPRPKSDRLRSPWWRYDYCSKLVENHRTPLDTDDKYVMELFMLLRTIKYEPIDVVEKYKDEHPDMSDALLIYEQGEGYRTDIEARVIAKFNMEEIGSVIGRPACVVDYYTKCFFDIVDKMNNTGYLNTWVIRPIMESAPFSEQALWKKMALCGGKEFIEYLTKCTPVQVQKLMDLLFEQHFSVKAMQAVNGIQPNSYNSIELIRLGIEKIDNRKKLEAFMPNSPENEYSVGIASMILKTMAYGLITEQMVPADPARAGKLVSAEAIKEQYSNSNLLEAKLEKSTGDNS